ncbi:hypothetical protein SO802_004343 [Lithocarpus litseifolius]|uniref:non-specific serine/threonine protein kinase n=1 Tax=Lithocarpus litseifolius TaxID=425828 RepID=A0AAW2E6N4_9ROSI
MVINTKIFRVISVSFLYLVLTLPLIYFVLKQICHGDLKLENTLLDGSPAPRLKIFDFGYSKSSLLHSRPKSTVRTPAYIAPEEPIGASQLLAWVGRNVASSSRPVVEWQPSFKLGDGLLLVTTSVRTWSQSQGGLIAQSLVHNLLLPKDIHCFSEATEESLAKRLQWHMIAITPNFSFALFAAQLTHVLGERMKELVEDVEREKALKDVAEDTTKEKGKLVEAAEKRAQAAKNSRVGAEKKLAEAEAMLGSVELKLVQAESLTLAQEDEVADLKVSLDSFEQRGYNLGFADAENFVEPIVHQAHNHGFSEGWLAALQAMGAAEDSPLRNLDQSPYPTPVPSVHSQADAADEEETLNMREWSMPLTLMWKWTTPRSLVTFMQRGLNMDICKLPTNQSGMRLMMLSSSHPTMPPFSFCVSSFISYLCLIVVFLFLLYARHTYGHQVVVSKQ